jgi:hypothetical protein
MAEQLYHNADGLPVRFGRSQGRRKNTVSGAGRIGAIRKSGMVQELIMQADLAGAARTMFTADRDNNGTMDGFEKGLDSFIPNGSYIIGTDVIALVTPAGGTTWQLGTFQVDGTAIDGDGLLVASAVAAGAAGAQAATVIAQDAYVTVKTAGTYTAGKLQIIVKYMLPEATLKP